MSVTDTASHNAPLAKPRLVLCAGTIPYAEFRERVEAASAAGFTAISLSPERFLHALKKERLSTQDMQQLLEDHAIKMDTVEPLLAWYGGNASDAEQLLYEMAKVFDAPSINAAPAFAPNIDETQLADHFSALCKRAAQHAIRVDLEFLPWSIVPNLQSAISLLEHADQQNSGITFDCLHFFRSGGSIETLSKLKSAHAERISNIQLCDAHTSTLKLRGRKNVRAIATMLRTGLHSARVMGLGSLISASREAHVTRPDANALMQEASCSRLLPGDGKIPIKEILRVIGGHGFQPNIGIEVFSLELNQLDPEIAAQRAMTAYRNLSLL